MTRPAEMQKGSESVCGLRHGEDACLMGRGSQGQVVMGSAFRASDWA